jgi:hypothetical protein
MRWLSRYHRKQRDAQMSKHGDGSITWELDDFEYIWDRPLQ